MSDADAWSERLTGVFAAIPTPFQSETVALDELARNLNMWRATPLQGLVLLGSNGEAPSLTAEERGAVVAAARDTVADELLLLAGTGAVSTAATVRLTQEAGAAGADAALVMAPPFYQPWLHDAALYEHFATVASEATVPVLLYNVPRLTGLELSPELVQELAQHPDIVGIKDSGGRLDRLARFVADTPDDFVVLAGSAPYVLPAYAAGARGAITAAAALFPWESCELHQQVEGGYVTEARQTAARLAAAHEGIIGRFGVPGLKATLALMGYYGGPPRRPLLPVSDEELLAIKAVLQEQRLVGC